MTSWVEERPIPGPRCRSFATGTTTLLLQFSPSFNYFRLSFRELIPRFFLRSKYFYLRTHAPTFGLGDVFAASACFGSSGLALYVQSLVFTALVSVNIAVVFAQADISNSTLKGK